MALEGALLLTDRLSVSRYITRQFSPHYRKVPRWYALLGWCLLALAGVCAAGLMMYVMAAQASTRLVGFLICSVISDSDCLKVLGGWSFWLPLALHGIWLVVFVLSGALMLAGAFQKHNGYNGAAGNQLLHPETTKQFVLTGIPLASSLIDLTVAYLEV